MDDDRRQQRFRTRERQEVRSENTGIVRPDRYPEVIQYERNGRGMGGDRDAMRHGGRGRGRGHDDIERGRWGRGRGRGYGDDICTQRQQGTRTIGYMKLRELSVKEPSEIVQVLAAAADNGDLQRSIIKCSNDRGYFKQFLRVLAKACKCHSMDASLMLILNAVRQDSFTHCMVDYTTFVLQEVLEGDVTEYVQQTKDLITIIHEICIRMPSATQALCLVMHSAIQHVVDAMDNSSDGIDDTLQQEFQDFTGHKNDILKGRYKQEKKLKGVPSEEGDPDDDFREYKVFPQSIELSADRKPFLRKNKKKGSYENLDHYLDVQYRLLREDFVGPLREGIAEFVHNVRENGNTSRLQDVRIYNHVRIISPICTKSGLCYAIQFDVSHMKVRWESSKRLLYGSLLCLSPNQFQTFYFATVTDRDPKDIEKGILQVKIEHDFNTIENLRKMEFTMAETTAYFEAYRHVLAGLQNIRDGDLPFEKYIVRCETNVEPPLYLRQNPDIKFDLRPLADETFVIREESRLTTEARLRRDHIDSFSADLRPAKDVKVLDRSNWPPARLLHLNHSQYEAVISALTNEFVIAQGPPGTGKTYIGLKIVKALLYNREVWSKNPDNGNPDPRPMLVVCYTNHALDQFLEGIQKFYRGDIVRVGSRSTSEALQNCSLKNFRGHVRNEVVSRNKRAAFRVLSDLQRKFDVIGERIKEAQTEILHEDSLRPFMDKTYIQLTEGFRELLHLYPDFRKQLPHRYSVIVEWLGLGNIAPELEIEEVENEREGETRAQNQRQANNEVRQNAGRQNQALDRQIVRAILEEFGDQDEEEEEDLVDVEDELNAIQNLRILDGETADENDHLSNIILKDEDFDFYSHSAVAFHVADIDMKQNGMNKKLWEVQKDQKKKIKKHIRHELATNDMMSKAETDRLHNLWAIPQEQKWRLYRRWIYLYKENLLRKIDPEAVDNAARRYTEALFQEDKEIMRRATVIGMTTTGAARYQSILQEIRPRIIVVEEAAEVLEAHVVTTLSSGCEHVIFIGDHKQLKPNPTVFKLAKNYNLDLSLFERMIRNNMKWDCLHLQHRMRPDIADLVRHIYPNLEDHESVQNMEFIKGVSSFLYFINHNHPEQQEVDVKSHLNIYEAEYTAALCRYLKQQGYEPTQITVLTLYSGQLFCLRRFMPRSEFQGVRVAVVDNYQGEENDIIILSLVRSNNKDHIGFLGVENRICVALSRAKKGFFVIGNFDMLSKSSELWKKMVQTMKKKGLFGPGLKLYCQKHPKDEGILASLPKDFNKAPEGGCSKKCEYRLSCGHVCQMFCHVLDPEHKDYKCRKPCKKILCENKHLCTKLCYIKCGECVMPMPKIIPRCGHEQLVPCNLHPLKFSCQGQCDKVLPCGHKCQEKCGDVHTKKCIVPVKQKWPCGHIGEVLCHKKYTENCTQLCGETLKCEHTCEGTCGDCTEGRLHKQCMKRCKRILVCGHQCEDRCNNCPPCRLICENQCSHSRCSKPCGEECVSCREPCEWSCKHYQCTKLCYEPCNRPRCNRPCRKRLPCTHNCIGLCGEPCPDMCRVCHRDIVTRIFFGSEDEPNARFVQLEDCRHIFEVESLDTWMDKSGESNGKMTVQLKLCPLCNTPIRRNLRYGRIIKSTLNDIEKVKATVRGDEIRMRDLKRDIESKMTDHFKTEYVHLYNEFGRFRKIRSERELVALDNQIAFMISALKLEKKWQDEGDITLILDKTNSLHDLKIFKNWIMSERAILTEQEIDDAQQELARLKEYFKLIQFLSRVRERRIHLKLEITKLIKKVENIVKDRHKFTTERHALVKQCLQTLNDICPQSGLNISEKERVEILKAMDLTKGHWFKCPKGHVYVIGDCGGATEEGKCPECGLTIGGQRHALRRDNAVATEMDGATMSAYDEAANMNLAALQLHQHLRI